jgi:D-3-phosphoglycerate dehydrogenase
VKEMMDYLENGNIRNSVNYPNCDMGRCDAVCRITIHHKNIPNMLGQFTALLASNGINIRDMTNKSNKNGFAYTMLDVESEMTKELVKGLEDIDGVIKVRLIRP